jgi:hypothetical protein
MKLFTRFLSVALLAAASAWAADPALLALVPAEAKVIVGVDVSRTTGSPLGQFFLSQMKQDDPDFARFITTTGFDPRRDVRELLFASDNQTRKNHGLVLARGVFNGPQILAAVKAENGGTITSYSGVDVLAPKPGALLAFVDGSIAIAGEEALVKVALDRRKGGPALPEATRATINQLGTRHDAWLFSTAPPARFADAVPDKQAGNAIKMGAMEAIEQATVGLKLGAVVEVAGEALTRSEKDATALTDVVRFLTGMLQLNRDKPGAAKFASILETLQLTTEGKAMRFTLSVPEADLEELLKSGRSARRVRAAR